MMRCSILFVVLLAGPSFAQDAVPTASAKDAPICTDRPTKSNFACTVPSGLVQVEADGFTWLNSSASGSWTNQVLFSNPTVKYGLTDSSDVQLNWVPFTRVQTRDAVGNVSTRSGVGDATVRFKQRLTGPQGTFQLAVLPFLKLPTAPTGISNGKVGGGMAVPTNISVPNGWTVTLGPQLDVLADSAGPGRHLGVTGLVNISKQIGKFTIYNEIWTNQDFDPAGTVRQYSYDVALAWLPHPTLQFDVGVNIGLNRNTPAIVSYIGVSTRF